MTSNAFTGLIKKHPELTEVFEAIREWIYDHPDVQVIDVRVIGQVLKEKNITLADIPTALSALADDGWFKRAFRVLDEDGNIGNTDYDDLPDVEIDQVVPILIVQPPGYLTDIKDWNDQRELRFAAMRAAGVDEKQIQEEFAYDPVVSIVSARDELYSVRWLKANPLDIEAFQKVVDDIKRENNIPLDRKCIVCTRCRKAVNYDEHNNAYCDCHHEQTPEEETAEILADPEMVAAIKQSEKEIDEGLVIPWEEIKHCVEKETDKSMCYEPEDNNSGNMWPLLILVATIVFMIVFAALGAEIFILM